MISQRGVSPRRQDFETEASLVDLFVDALQAGHTAFGSVVVATEWDHSSGFVDVLARNGTQTLLAFEAKLADWRRAFMQAYRNTAYANRTFVLLPEKTAHRALQAREEFELRGIGLCSFDGMKVQILIEAIEQDPLLAWVRARAHEYLDELEHESRPCSRPSNGGRRSLQSARV